MAFTVYDSKVAYFLFNGQELTSYISAVRGLPGAGELLDCTTLNQTGRKWYRSLEDILFSLDLFWSDEATIGSETLIGPQRSATSPVAFIWGPKGSTATFIKYSGNCFVKTYPIEEHVGDLIICTAQFQVDGVITRGTF